MQVDLRDLVDAPVRGTVRVDLSLDGTSSFSATLAAPGRQGGLRIDHRGHADVRVTVLDGKSAGANAAFTLDLPAERPPDAALADIDRAMASLRSVREAQTLSGGGPLILNHIEYLAPDRVRFITVEPTGEIQETRLIGRDRFDRDPGGGWTRSDLGFPSRVPSTAYARGATRVRIVGHSQDGFEELVEIAFVQGGSYYRVWAGAHDHRVRSYSMMARGHFMTGAYADYDAPIAISVP